MYTQEYTNNNQTIFTIEREFKVFFPQQGHINLWSSHIFLIHQYRKFKINILIIHFLYRLKARDIRGVSSLPTAAHQNCIRLEIKIYPEIKTPQRCLPILEILEKILNYCSS